MATAAAPDAPDRVLPARGELWGAGPGHHTAGGRGAFPPTAPCQGSSSDATATPAHHPEAPLGDLPTPPAPEFTVPVPKASGPTARRPPPCLLSPCTRGHQPQGPPLCPPPRTRPPGSPGRRCSPTPPSARVKNTTQQSHHFMVTERGGTHGAGSGQARGPSQVLSGCVPTGCHGRRRSTRGLTRPARARSPLYPSVLSAPSACCADRAGTKPSGALATPHSSSRQSRPAPVRTRVWRALPEEPVGPGQAPVSAGQRGLDVLVRGQAGQVAQRGHGRLPA